MTRYSSSSYSPPQPSPPEPPLSEPAPRIVSMVNEWHVAVAKPASRPEWRDAARAPSFNYHYEYDDEVEGDSFLETGDDGTRGTTYPYDVADISPGGGGGGGSHGHGSNGASKPDATFPSAASLGVATSPAPPRGVAASAALPAAASGAASHSSRRSAPPARQSRGMAARRRPR